MRRLEMLLETYRISDNVPIMRERAYNMILHYAAKGCCEKTIEAQYLNHDLTDDLQYVQTITETIAESTQVDIHKVANDLLEAIENMEM